MLHYGKFLHFPTFFLLDIFRRLRDSLSSSPARRTSSSPRRPRGTSTRSRAATAGHTTWNSSSGDSFHHLIPQSCYSQKKENIHVRDHENVKCVCSVELWLVSGNQFPPALPGRGVHNSSTPQLYFFITVYAQGEPFYREQLHFYTRSLTRMFQ